MTPAKRNRPTRLLLRLKALQGASLEAQCGRAMSFGAFSQLPTFASGAEQRWRNAASSNAARKSGGELRERRKPVKSSKSPEKAQEGRLKLGCWIRSASREPKAGSKRRQKRPNMSKALIKLCVSKLNGLLLLRKYKPNSAPFAIAPL